MFLTAEVNKEISVTDLQSLSKLVEMVLSISSFVQSMQTIEV